VVVAVAVSTDLMLVAPVALEAVVLDHLDLEELVLEIPITQDLLM
tara:strand:+ start:328 stop:462 length:135 start_codon:yes stop_codon:yes gene_type:complete